ncbi:BglG family transcription antiterminator [Erysipelothrix sp. HDW6B]|uniref:BglG family transcription antiterminator n=1 Tax=Erysipelothrix sp. HDW6B TaxID=2714929 RepID=UPI00140BE58F|nr:BglG family transcription antiterminator [Erysipelothrix sp. HDW6B]QIK86309.1 BglG family transcription antiterminator [Erysipelothrix sp. HDW6B]
MNSRQRKILEYLSEQDAWIKGKELSKVVGVTDRTIRSDIDALNQNYPGIVASSTREGYLIELSIYQKYKEASDEIIPQTPNERSIYIIKELLFSKQRRSIVALQEALFVSEHTIEGDIKRIRELIKPYGGLKLVRTDNHIYFDGNEHVKRKIYRDLLADEIKDNFININRTASLYKRFDLVRVTEIFEATLADYNYQVRETAVPMIVVHIGITIERMLSGHYLDKSNNNLQDSVEFQIAQDFFHKIVTMIPITYSEVEAEALATILMGYKNAVKLSDTLQYEGKDVNISKLLADLTDVIFQTFDLDFTDDEDFQNGLRLHLQSLVMRVTNETVIPNAHLQEIKKSYPLIFEMGLVVSRLIGNAFGFELSESEVGFIAIHIGAAYDRLSSSKKYQVMLIAPNNRSLSKLTKGKITNMFKDRIEIAEIQEYFVEKDVLNHDIDLIISILPIEHSLEIPTVQISMFVNHDDESKIFRVLNEMDKNRFKHEFGNQFGTLIDERFFFNNLDLDTPEAVIDYVSKALQDNFIVSEHFKQSVLDREKMSSTSFIYAIAIPHPLDLESHQSKVAVALLKKPIRWGSYDVKLVMLLAITEEDSAKMWLFFDWLSETITNTEKMSKLLQSKNRNEFVHWMMND